MDHPKHMVVVGCLIQNSREEILLIRHRKRGWEIPQGRVEEGEALVAAAHREVYEETGLEVALGELAAVWSKLSPPQAVIFNFLASYRGGELRPSEETPELGWFNRDAALRQVTHPVNHDRLRTLLEFAGQTFFKAYSTSPYRVFEETASHCGGRGE